MIPADRRALLDAALGYTEQSPQFRIFPADPRTKRPLIKTGADHAEHASTDPATIERWLLVDFPGCAIGAPTGATSGVIVIDADRKHDGEALLALLEGALGALSWVRVVRTQSGGLHIYFAHPGSGIRVRTGAGADSPIGRLLGKRPGIDVRADGGIVVLPPSIGYRWIADGDEPFPALPPMWLRAIQGEADPPPRSRARSTPRTADNVVADMIAKMAPIAEGDRNGRLHKIGVRLRHDGRTEGEILDALERMNVALVTPSLSDREISKIARSAARGTR